MRKSIKRNLEKLDKEQLIYIIDQLHSLYFGVGEICLHVSKWDMDSQEAISDIRELCNDIQYDTKFRDKHFSDYINMKLGKITPAEYRKIVLEIDKDKNDD